MFLKVNLLCNSTNISKCIMIKIYGARSCNVPYFNEFFVFMYIIKLPINKLATYLKYEKLPNQYGYSPLRTLPIARDNGERP